MSAFFCQKSPLTNAKPTKEMVRVASNHIKYRSATFPTTTLAIRSPKNVQSGWQISWVRKRQVAITAVACKEGVPCPTKFVKPAIIIAQALGFSGCIQRPAKKPGARASPCSSEIRIFATRHASHNI